MIILVSQRQLAAKTFETWGGGGPRASEWVTVCMTTRVRFLDVHSPPPPRIPPRGRVEHFPLDR